jgi:hypothetical protein
MSAMKIHELIEQIKENENYWNGMAITAQQATALAELTDAEYDEIVTMLLREPVADYREVHGEDYRKTYAHLVYGALLFCMRPNPALYVTALAGTLAIADPSSIQYGVAALRQARPIEQIVADLLAIAEQHKDDTEITSRTAWVFYWLGISEEQGWSQYINLALDDQWAALYRKSPEPETNRQEIMKLVPKVTALMKTHTQTLQDEMKHAKGYARHPVQPGEFDGWENEQVWG